MRRLAFTTGLILLITTLSCRGPLAKPEASAAAASETATAPGTAHVQEAITGKEEIRIEPLEGGITIGELFSKKQDYSGKTVRIRGKVTKVNSAIMEKNWIHIQDGTGFEDQYDLTITSDQLAETGTIVIVEGKIALDKDFGYGYTYTVLMENGKINP